MSHNSRQQYPTQELEQVMSNPADFLAAVGNTPLIRLRGASLATGCEILRQGRVHEPGRFGEGPRRARHRRGCRAAWRCCKPGGTVVEGTAGNTGIGLAHVCAARGYRCVIVMPDNQSPEKYALIEALGAEVHRVKTVPYSDPNHYQKVAGRMAGERAGAYLDQPVRQRRQSARAFRQHRAGDLGADRRARRRLRVGAAAPAARSAAFPTT